MERIILFNTLLLLASGYALLRGGAPERIVGLAMLVAGGLTRLSYHADYLPAPDYFAVVHWGVLVIDLALLGVLLAVALHADRFWTLWLVAFQALGTGGHLVRGLDHGIEPVAYAILLASWSYPMILLLVLGTARQARRRRQGGGRDWSHAAPAYPGSGS